MGIEARLMILQTVKLQFSEFQTWYVKLNSFLALKQPLLSSADNLCKQFGTRSGLTGCQSLSGSKLFGTRIFAKVNFEKSQQTSTKA